jgi:hypothetical protein
MSVVYSTPHAPARPAARAWRIVRLLTANPWTTIGLPLIILGIIFGATWTIWWLIMTSVSGTDAADAADGIRYNGAAAWIFVYMLVVAVQAVNLAFPLALGYGSTRRAFTVGSGVTFLLLSAGYAAALTFAAWIEELTGGWGLRGTFFRTFIFASDDGWAAQWWIYFCWFAFFFFTGMIFAAVFVRWKAFGLTTALLALGVLLLGALAIVTLTDSWPAVGEALVALGTLGIATVLLVPAVLAAGVGHLLLRRATPRG